MPVLRSDSPVQPRPFLPKGSSTPADLFLQGAPHPAAMRGGDAGGAMRAATPTLTSDGRPMLKADGAYGVGDRHGRDHPERARANGAREERSRCFSIVGSPHYVAPEVLRATGHSTPVDWWALGVIAFELLTGYLPFAGSTIRSIHERVLEAAINWPQGAAAQHISADAADLIAALLRLTPAERLGANGAHEVRGHGFFTNVSWADLLQHDSFYIPIQAHSSQNAPTSPIVSPVASPAASPAAPSVEKREAAARAKEGEEKPNDAQSVANREHGRAVPSEGFVAEGAPAATVPRSNGHGVARPGGIRLAVNVAGHVDDGDGGSTSVEERGLDSFDMSDDAMFNGAHGSLLLAGSHLSPLYPDDRQQDDDARASDDAAMRGGKIGAANGAAVEGAAGELHAGSAQSPPNHQLPNFDYANVSNLMRINAVAEQNVGSVSNHEACKVCKYHLGQLNSATWADEDDFGEGVSFVDVRLHDEAGRDTELTFRENVVRISQRPVEGDGAADEFGTSDTDSAGGSSLASAAPTAHRAHHPLAQYEGGSDFIEIWFKNECRLVSGLTLWGAYTYGRWWKGLAARYVRVADVDDDDDDGGGGGGGGDDVHADGIVGEPLYSYAELEHEAAGPTLTVGLWRMRTLPKALLEEKRDSMRVQICLAKAKAFGIKRTVHRISLAYADLVGKRTTITWLQD